MFTSTKSRVGQKICNIMFFGTLYRIIHHARANFYSISWYKRVINWLYRINLLLKYFFKINCLLLHLNFRHHYTRQQVNSCICGLFFCVINYFMCQKCCSYNCASQLFNVLDINATMLLINSHFLNLKYLQTKMSYNTFVSMYDLSTIKR